LAHERASLLDFVLQRYLTGSPLIELLLLHLFFQSAFLFYSLPMYPMNSKRLSFIAVTERAIAFLPVLL